MSNKYSKTVVDKYSRVWTKNLVSFEKCITSRIGPPFIEKPLDSFNRMLKKTFIIGRYNYLALIEKSRKERVKLIAVEISKLWNKLNFQSISKKSVGRKIEKVIEKHDKYLKKPGKKEECSVFGDLFDITNIKGIWLSLEDKKFYNIQLLSSGEVGHSTNTQVSLHPSKVRVCNAKDTTSTSKANNCPGSSSTVSEECGSDLDSQDNYEPVELKKSRKRVYNRTKLAPNLVITESLSTKNQLESVKSYLKKVLK